MYSPRNATEAKDAAYDDVKNDFKSLEVGTNETVVEYFVLMNVVLTKLWKHKVTMHAVEI